MITAKKFKLGAGHFSLFLLQLAGIDEFVVNFDVFREFDGQL